MDLFCMNAFFAFPIVARRPPPKLKTVAKDIVTSVKAHLLLL